MAEEKYSRGGDTVAETWSDKDIKKWLKKTSGTKSELMKLFKYHDGYDSEWREEDYLL